jgi:heme A synthase
VVAALQALHVVLSRAAILFAIVLGIWGTYQLARYRQVSGGFRSSYLLMIALTVVQGIVGGFLLLGGQRPHELLHVVYGVFAVLFLPAVYFYSERRDDLREAAFLAAACWIVVVALVRGLLTG